MSVIWKFPIEIADRFSVEMPTGAQVLCVQVQRDEPVLYAEVDPKAEPKQKQFLLFGTGHSIETADRIEYVGTFQLRSGDLVFHLYEVTHDFEELPF